VWITGDSSGVVNIPGSLTVAGSAVGGASTVGALTDVSMDITNFVDGILIQPNSDGSAPTTGTLSNATGNTGIGKSTFTALTSGEQNTAYGYNSLAALTSGFKNTAIGSEAGAAITNSNFNTMVGFEAGKSISDSSGGHNTIMGYESGEAITTGPYNVLYGLRSGKAITTGTRNIAIGNNALDNADTENDNIAIGYDALGGVIAGGEKNVAIGNYAGDAITSADNSVLIGYDAGTSTTTAWATVGIGHEALKSNQYGSQNVAVGNEALENINNHFNVAVGSQALQTSTSGIGNTVMGHTAGKNSGASASYNTIIGYNAGDGIDGSYNTAIGHEALKAGLSASGADNTAIGTAALKVLTTGSTNIAVGHDAADNITTGSNNVVIGAADVTATGSDQLSISSGDGSPVWMTSDSTGVVDFPNGLTNNGAAIESAFETITDVTIGSGTSGTTSGIYFGANDEAGVVAGEVSNASTANDGYIELMNCDLDTESGSSGLQTIELTVQIQDETNAEIESFKALVQGIERTVLGTTVREVNFTEWAIIYSGGGRIGTLDADYDSGDDTIRIRYQNKQGSTATLTATFYAVTMGNNT
jgi:hypothetical protein